MLMQLPDEDLHLIFSRFGQILSCEVIRDKRTGDSLQYAFIEFENQKDCEQAYFKMQGVLIDDHRIHVDFSQSVRHPLTLCPVVWHIPWLTYPAGFKTVRELAECHCHEKERSAWWLRWRCRPREETTVSGLGHHHYHASRR